MDAHKSALICYQQILELSDRMLQLAMQSEWEKLIELEQEYLSAVSKLTSLIEGKNLTLTPLDQERIKVYLEKILNNEQTIRDKLQARMDELRELIGQSTRQQSVNAAYHKFSSGNSMLPGGGKR
ncbi:flagellar protein FliT [Musicola paradisiaca]|uniref:Flagellar protein FliT n=1 Tax=Musicola paradisiaca (strain Ech703) TaxID=579405 RepID=C6C373_MUSP7|nr:flagellar protein FliT [Musicola paradisiaca]ACS85338.1 flagellar export chaperone [Musicola paradisiaca Ech703]